MRGEYSFGKEEFHGLAAVPDGPLPVLGCFSARDVLKLVWGQPRLLEPDARALRPLAQPRQIQEGRVAAALDLKHYVTVSHLWGKSKLVIYFISPRILFDLFEMMDPSMA